MYGVLFQIEHQFSELKMHAFLQFSVWILRALAKFCYLHKVLNCTKITLYYLEMRRTYAQ